MEPELRKKLGIYFSPSPGNKAKSKKKKKSPPRKSLKSTVGRLRRASKGLRSGRLALRRSAPKAIPPMVIVHESLKGTFKAPKRAPKHFKDHDFFDDDE